MKRGMMYSMVVAGVAVFSTLVASVWTQAADPTETVKEANGGGVINLETLAIPDSGATPADVRTLSNGVKVFLHKRWDMDLLRSRLVLVSADGTNRAIPTKGAVIRMRCAGDRIYTEEMMQSPTPKEIRSLYAAGLDEDVSFKPKRHCEIREYDPAAGTSRTVWLQPPLSVQPGPVDFLPGEGCLYIIRGMYDSRTMTNDIRITTLMLADLTETSVDIAAVSGNTWANDFALHDGWLYYFGGWSDTTGLPTDPAMLAKMSPKKVTSVFQRSQSSRQYTVCRINLATGERQTLAAGKNIRSLCVMQKPKSVVYVEQVAVEGQTLPDWTLRVVPLDGSLAGPQEYPLPSGVREARVQYDPVANAVTLWAREPENLYRVAFAY